MIAAVLSPGAIPDFVHPPVPGESHDFYGDSHLDTIKLPLAAVLEQPRVRTGNSSDLLALQGDNGAHSGHSSAHPLDTADPSGNESGHQHNSGASVVAGANVSEGSSDDTSWSRLLEATVSGNAGQVQEILSMAPELRESIDNLSSATGMNPLHFAASRGHEEIVRILIDQAGAALDMQDREGETALLKASYSGWFSVVCFLLKRGANVHQRDKDGWTALHNASSRGYIDIAQVLLEKGEADINARSKMGHTPLINAASKGDIDMSLYFLNHARANPLLKNSFSEAAYDVAAANSVAHLCDILQSSERQWWKAEHTPDQVFDPLSFHNTVLMAVYENQRATGSFPLSLMAPKFSMNALSQQDLGGPWSLPNGRPSTKDDVHLPLVPAQGQFSSRSNMQRGWFWLTEWVIDLADPNVDNEGWQYGKSFTDSTQLWTSVAPTSGGNWVRRRKWIRVMKRRMDMLSPSEEDSISGEQLQELAGNYMKRSNLALRPDDPFSDREQELARYRQAIQILLRGIKVDKDPVSKVAATALINDYLEHAEKLTKSIRVQSSLLEDTDQLEAPRLKAASPTPQGYSGSSSELRSLTLQKSRPSDAETSESLSAELAQGAGASENSSEGSFASAQNNIDAEEDVAEEPMSTDNDAVDEDNQLPEESHDQELLDTAVPVEEELEDIGTMSIVDHSSPNNHLTDPEMSVAEGSRSTEVPGEDGGSANIPIPSTSQGVPEVTVIGASPAATQADPFPLARLSRISRSPPASTPSRRVETQDTLSLNGADSIGSSSNRPQTTETDSSVNAVADAQPSLSHSAYTNGSSTDAVRTAALQGRTEARLSGSPVESQLPTLQQQYSASSNNLQAQDRGLSHRAQSMQSSSNQHYQQGPLTDARWESDHKAIECRECHRKFSLWLRRHHCRRCGHVVCDRCSSHRATLHPSMVVYDPTSSEAYINHQTLSRRGTLQSYRVCDSCFGHLGLARSNSLGSGSGSSFGAAQSASSSTQIQHHRSHHGHNSQQYGVGHASSAPSGHIMDGSMGVYIQSGGYSQDFQSHSSSRSSSSSNLHPSPLVRNASSSSLMAECPVCGAILAGMEGGKAAQEAHVQDCLEGKPGQGSGPINNVRYIVYKLPADSPLIDQECAICFEEFVAGRTVARLNCLCTYHRHCIHSWLQHGKACPVHYR